MKFFFGFLLALLAGVWQGSFYLPAMYTKKWKWEHSWLVFALSTMLVISWLLTFILIPNIWEVLGSVTAKEILVILLFGGGWGIGAIGTGPAWRSPIPSSSGWSRASGHWCRWRCSSRRPVLREDSVPADFIGFLGFGDSMLRA